ncbi:OmpA family protein [Acidimangrovimonas sediminis]|uniref:OmpA family protein n=1 Tax=Acidimangrovimonas sediminis TaxID=2056283 RepID=UPI0011AEFF2F|nr:OmpA family protein [Acidimangrovimonas sediminis]
MTRKLLKTTTALCLALSIAQPIPTIAWAQQAPQKCDQGKDCPPPGQSKKPDHKNRADAQKRHDEAQKHAEEQRQQAKHQQEEQQTQARQTQDQQRQDAQKHAAEQRQQAKHEQEEQQKQARPQQDQQRPDAQKHAEEQRQQAKHQQEEQQTQARQTQDQQRQDAQKHAEDQRQQDGKAPQPAPKPRADKGRDHSSRPQDGGPKPAPQDHAGAQSQPAPDNAPNNAPDTAPDASPRPKAERGDKPQPQSQPQNRQADAPRDQKPAPQQSGDSRRPGPAFGSWHRDGDTRPEAARAPEHEFQKDKKTREVKIDRQDVFDHSRNEYRDSHKHDGMTDLQKFGLVALGAVAAGAVLSNGDHVVNNTGDRVVVRSDSGQYRVYHDDDSLLRRPGARYYTQDYNDGTVLSKVIYKDGTTVYTVRDADGRVLRRTVDRPDRKPVVLFDDAAPAPTPQPEIRSLPQQSPIDLVYTAGTREGLLRETMLSEPKGADGRHYALDQIRTIARVRYLAPEIDVKPLTFPTGSSAISNTEADNLSTLGKVMAQMVQEDPTQVFLVEGHSDAVGDRASNLALSDARAEAAAQVLVQEYGVPPENLVTQGYGESDLKEQTQGASAVNRRIIVRPLGKLLPPAQMAQN